MSTLGRVSPRPMRSRLRRVLIPVGVVIGAALVATSVRTGLGLYHNYQFQRAQAEARQAAPMPTSAPIEQEWGIRITVVQLLADNGLVEVRYLVTDSTRSSRLHGDPNSLQNIPWIKVEGTGLSIKSKSVMFHFQHGVGQGLDGRTYSIIYGNAGNAIHPHAKVAIVMPDGLELQHVPVAG
jgi:hypothetical protein